jgi:hypothetical protein
MLDLFYSMNWVLAGFAVVALFVALSVGGLLATRGLVERLWKDRKEPPHDVIGFFFGTLGVFYGIALGLVAVAAWESWSQVDDHVKEEGALVRALRSDTKSFPHPLNERLPEYLHQYVEFEKDTAWAYHAIGKRPPPDSAIKRFRECLFNFTPRTMGEQNLQAEVMRRWNDVLRLRSVRQFSAESHVLSKVIWFVVLFGALLNVAVTWLFVIVPRRAHVALTSMLAAMIGILVFLLLAMDQPFRGQLLTVEKAPFALADSLAHAEKPDGHSGDSPRERCVVPTASEGMAP